MRPSGTTAHHGGHDHVSSVRVVVEVRLRSAGGIEVEAKLVVHLDSIGVDKWRTAHSNGQAQPYRHSGGKKLQIGAWPCSLQGWMGSDG